MTRVVDEEHHDRLERLVENARAELASWTDASGHDPGLALVELLAFLSDTLSSSADAIARESYLGSRARISHLQVTIAGDVVIDADWNEPAAPTACGVHRAVVIDAADPQESHRLLVSVPSLLGSEHRWALPCLPTGVPAELPPVGATVWVAFEACDLDRPVWLGGAP